MTSMVSQSLLSDMLHTVIECSFRYHNHGFLFVPFSFLFFFDIRHYSALAKKKKKQYVGSLLKTNIYTCFLVTIAAGCFIYIVYNNAGINFN